MFKEDIILTYANGRKVFFNLKSKRISLYDKKTSVKFSPKTTAWEVFIDLQLVNKIVSSPKSIQKINLVYSTRGGAGKNIFAIQNGDLIRYDKIKKSWSLLNPTTAFSKKILSLLLKNGTIGYLNV